MENYDPYQAYTDGNLLSDNPLQLVVALYEGAIDAVRSARLCMESGDIWGRTRAINKAISILTELMKSLDREKGGEIAKNLGQLYSYMQRRLIEAHAQKTTAPIEEVAGLMDTLAQGWKQASANSEQGQRHLAAAQESSNAAGEREREFPETPYGAYWNDRTDAQASPAYCFSL